MSARDDYPLVNNATASVEFDRQAQAALDEIDRLRDHKERLRTELAKHGWGDFHYGDQPQDPEIVALLEETS